VIEAVIFDMDGTLLDSEPLYMQVFQESAKDFGFELSEALYLSMVGSTMTAAYQALVDAFGPGFPLAAFQQAWPERWRQRVAQGGAPLKPGVAALMEQLEQRRLKRGVATSSHQAEAELCLRVSGLLPRLQAVVTGDQVARGKPEPEIYLEAASRLKVAPERCLAFEDSSLGATAALRAGMTVIIVPDLLAPTPEVAAAAYAVIPSIAQGMPLIERLLAGR
jgi:HAD superfamily hydrolase (TIGR01509 family)